MEALRKQAARILQEKKKHKLWLTVFLCMAALVTAGTVTALKMSGQALSHKEKVLTCGIEVHQHTEQCHDSEGNLVCGQADYVVHVHNDDCRDKDGNLVCTLPEIEPHEHEDSCFAEEKNLICTQKESAGHQHDENCYTKVQGELICGMEGTGHQHGAECYTKVQGELICASEEEGHEHTDECYAWNEELTCGQTEEIHEHTDECYAWTEELTCEIEEGYDAHEHTDECYVIETVNICGELELHTHEDDCYDEDGNLICGQTELLEHVHADDCFEIVEIEVSDEESGESEESGEEDTGTETSGEESGESEADGEDEEAQPFHKTYEDAEIRVVAEYDESANIPEEAQLVAERIEAAAEGDAQDDSETEEPETDDAQGTDSADETQEPPETDAEAGVQIPAESDAGDEAGSESEEGEIEPLVDEGTEPAEADTQPEGADSADDVEPADTEPVESVETATTATEEVSYRLKFLVDGKEIEPEGAVTFTVWNPEEAEGEPQVIQYAAGDGSDARIVTLIKKVAAETEEILRKTYEDDKVKVVAEYTKSANIPEEAELIARQITAESDPETYAMREEELRKQVGNENATMDILLSIGFYVSDGENGLKEVEPEDTVTVTLQFLDKEGTTQDNHIDIIHFAEDGTEILGASDVDENGATTFKTDSFSDFGGSFGEGDGKEASIVPTDLTVGAYSKEGGNSGENVPVFVSEGGRWVQNGTATLRDATNGDFCVGATVDDMRRLYSSDAEITKLNGSFDKVAPGTVIEKRWIGYSTSDNPGDGLHITTADGIKIGYRQEDMPVDFPMVYWNVNPAWLFRGAEKSVIKAIYYLPDNETIYSDASVPATLFSEETINKVYLNPGNNSYGSSYKDGIGKWAEYAAQYGTIQRTELTTSEPDANGIATVQLPTDSGLTAEQRPSAYNFQLVGWYNIANKTYYSVEGISGSTIEAQVDLNQKNVFYADWKAASYDFFNPNEVDEKNPLLETADTNDFIKTTVFDFNELFNIYSANYENRKMDGSDEEFEVWSMAEGFRTGFWQENADGGRTLTLGDRIADGIVFIGATGKVFTPENDMERAEVGPLIKPLGRGSGNESEEALAVGKWGNGLSQIVRSLFSTEGNTLGVHYIGEGNHLYYYDAENKKYVYDSDHYAASYQATDRRFYITSQPQTLTNSPAFLPFNGNGYLTEESSQVNYHFGMKSEINFYLPEEKTEDFVFEFTGDDDVWVFVDGELVLDMGGIHAKKEGSINFTSEEVIANGIRQDFHINRNSKEHKLEIYYMERGAGKSNCKISFNIVPRYIYEEATASTVKVEKTWENVPVGTSHPGEITVELYDTKNKTVIDSKPLNADNEWSYTWEGLPKNGDYEVREVTVPGYQVRMDKETIQSHDYWVVARKPAAGEGDLAEQQENPLDAAEIIILDDSNVQKDSDNVTRYALSHSLTSKTVTEKYGVIPKASASDEIKWKPVKIGDGYRLKQSTGDGYLMFSDNALQLTSEETKATIFTWTANGLSSGNLRIACENGTFSVREGATAAGEIPNCVNVYTCRSVPSRGSNYVITNTYLPTVTINKVDRADNEKFVEAKFKLFYTAPGAEADTYNEYYNSRTKKWAKYSATVTNLEFVMDGGTLSLPELRDGTYTLIETEAPDGYQELSDSTVKIVVTSGKIDEVQSGTFETNLNGKQEKIAEKKTDLLVIVKNEAIPVTTVNVKFVKYGIGASETVPLKGAGFEIYKTDKTGDYYIQNGEILPVKSAGIVVAEENKVALVEGKHESGDDGVFYNNEKLSGTYYVKESNVPDGYNQPTGLIRISVKDNGEIEAKVYTSTSSTHWVVVPGVVDVDQNANPKEVKVYNTAGFELPETGSIGTQPYTIGGAALTTATVLLMYGYSMRRKKRKGGLL